ncbi:hypothetical protein HID58_047465 [Brassica napus]|uniref:NmrA-like domain-containing protein n=1 Tax=Brassica napus TaxID=3708 RepID=A0ABQ8AZG4_BRANA|nr:hypothetical protein HID58_047465 [Brassica napus]
MFIKAIKQVDVVISTVGSMQILDQTKIISAIKEAGNIKVGQVLLSRGNRLLQKKILIRRAIEAEGVPYTYIVNNCFAGLFLPVINKEEDIAAYTIKTVDDPKSLNKIIYIKTSQEQSVNERNGRLVGEKESPVPMNVILSINHSVFVKGDQTNFTIEASFGLEAFVLYLDVIGKFLKTPKLAR